MLSFFHVNQLSLGRDLWKIESRARLTTCQYDRKKHLGEKALFLFVSHDIEIEFLNEKTFLHPLRAFLPQQRSGKPLGKLR